MYEHLIFTTFMLLLELSRNTIAVSSFYFHSVTSTHNYRIKKAQNQLRKDQNIVPTSLRACATNNESNEPKEQLTHNDVKWYLRPPPETPNLEKIKILAAANVIRTDFLLRNEVPPPIVCPKGGKALLEAYDLKGKKIAKFGLTTSRGPSSDAINETIEELYGSNHFGNPGIGAIIYMYVEPEYRGMGIGKLALEAISSIQCIQGCDFTVLVADDNGNGKLIKWYEDNGFAKAPKLQKALGSPNGEYGVTMISPIDVASDIFARCKIQWW